MCTYVNTKSVCEVVGVCELLPAESFFGGLVLIIKTKFIPGLLLLFI